jgi:hypothetical protein
MKCKFCGEEKPLIKAHIFPQQFHKPITCAEKKHHVVIADALDKPGILQSGSVDKTILCEKCDNEVIGKWDKYATEFFRQQDTWDKTTISGDDGPIVVYIVEDFDYAPLKLFFISLLWRASVSSLGVYNGVKLGAYEIKAWKMMKTGDPGTENDFGVAMFKLTESQRYTKPPTSGGIHQSIAGPQLIRENNINMYRTAFLGTSTIIKVDRRKMPDFMDYLCLSPSQPLRIMEIEFDGGWEHRYLFGAAHAMKARIKS